MKVSQQVEELEKQVETLKQENQQLRKSATVLNHAVEGLTKACESVIPNQVFTHKERRNTTVKFLDGSQQTVKRRKGEKDCIETAIAYCVLKQLLTANALKKLIEEREEH